MEELMIQREDSDTQNGLQQHRQGEEIEDLQTALINEMDLKNHMKLKQQKQGSFINRIG